MSAKLLSIVLALVLLASPTTPWVQASTATHDLEIGIRQVKEGDYDAAILILDSVVERLREDPERARELADAYLYLGVAHVATGHEIQAKAQFRDAIRSMIPGGGGGPSRSSAVKALSIEAYGFPDEAVRVFEEAKVDWLQAPAKEESRTLPILLAVGAAAGVGIAVGAGASSTSPSEGPTTTAPCPLPPPTSNPNDINFVGADPPPCSQFSLASRSSVTIRLRVDVQGPGPAALDIALDDPSTPLSCSVRLGLRIGPGMGIQVSQGVDLAGLAARCSLPAAMRLELLLQSANRTSVLTRKAIPSFYTLRR